MLESKEWKWKFYLHQHLSNEQSEMVYLDFFSHKHIIKYKSTSIIGNNRMKLLGKKILILGIKHQHYSNWELL
jgi:hypothetical protein